MMFTAPIIWTALKTIEVTWYVHVIQLSRDNIDAALIAVFHDQLVGMREYYVISVLYIALLQC